MSDLEKRITDIQINHLFIGEENGFSIWMHWIPTSSPFCGDVTWYLVRPKLLPTFIGVSPNYRHFPQKNTLDIENTRGICLCPLFWAVYHTYIYIYMHLSPWASFPSTYFFVHTAPCSPSLVSLQQHSASSPNVVAWVAACAHGELQDLSNFPAMERKHSYSLIQISNKYVHMKKG